MAQFNVSTGKFDLRTELRHWLIATAIGMPMAAILTYVITMSIWGTWSSFASLLIFTFSGSILIGIIKGTKDRRKKNQIIKEHWKPEKRDQQKYNNGYETALTKCKHIAMKHKLALANQRSQLVFLDPYGKEITDKWYKLGIQYFLNQHVEPEFDTIEKKWLLGMHRRGRSNFEKIIDDTAIAAQGDLRQDIVYDETMTGHEYESFCQRILEKNNWQVQNTPGSGDQGVDLIAEKNGMKVVIQCKKYNKPVGNKAIQEIYSGMNYYKVFKGIVITNSSFTPSAIALAQQHSVLLLHHDVLNSPELDSMLA